jgi:hypothetical protein
MNDTEITEPLPPSLKIEALNARRDRIIAEIEEVIYFTSQCKKRAEQFIEHPAPGMFKAAAAIGKITQDLIDLQLAVSDAIRREEMLQDAGEGVSGKFLDASARLSGLLVTVQKLLSNTAETLTLEHKLATAPKGKKVL